MELLTTTEIAEKWKITRRRVSMLYSEGRIKGAVLKGNTWLIPQMLKSLRIRDGLSRAGSIGSRLPVVFSENELL